MDGGPLPFLQGLWHMLLVLWVRQVRDLIMFL